MPDISRTIGPYRILDLIGSGGMGEVFLAEDTRLGRRVALKRLYSDTAQKPDARARLLREARAVAALNHPRIAAVYDIIDGSDTDPTQHIVMEYVPGESLDDTLSRGALPMARAIEIALEIVEALQAAHARGIIHRDLKPANIRVMPDGHIKVLDFGIAKIVPSDDAQTTTATGFVTGPGRVIGTPAYMSPEQRQGLAVDQRSDYYSFGIILFEMLTGDRPTFQSRHIAGPAASLDLLVQRMLALDPDKRPQTAAEIVRELQSVTAQTTAAPAAAPRRVGWRTLVAAAATVAIAVAAAAAWRVSLRPAASAERPVMVILPLTNLSGDPSKDYIGIGISDTLSTHLARLSSVSVVDRGATDASNRTADRQKLMRDTGANLIVDGSVQQLGDRLHVNARLLKPDGVIAWSGDSEASITDLFGVESRLASALINALSVSVSAAEIQQAVRPPTGNRDALDQYWQAIARMERRDSPSLSGAITLLEAVVARDPEFAQAHASLGEAYRRKYFETNTAAWMEKAVREVERALAIDGNQPEVRMSLAAVYRSTGRNAEAVAQLGRVLAQQPSNDDAHRLRGQILGAEGKLDEAVAELRQAITLRPQYWGNYQSLGEFLFKNGSPADAVAPLTRVVDLRPDDAAAYQQLGAAYQAIDDRPRARANYERALRLSANPATHSNLGSLDYADGRYAAAAASFEAAVKLRPNRALYHRNLGDAYLKLAREGDARREYESAAKLADVALKVNPNDATTMSQLAVYEAKLRRGPDAKRHVDAAVAINPSSADVLYRRAVVLALTGSRDAAVKALADAVAHGYSTKLVLEDDDLAPLRKEPQVQALLRAPQPARQP